MKFLIPFLFLQLTINDSFADGFDQHFATVFIDQETEKQYGPVPLDRSLLAIAINTLADAGAKGVMLKFFIDLAKDEPGDKALVKAISRIPVLLQARIDDSEPSPNPLPTRFIETQLITTSINAKSGWIPHPKFSSLAYDIGFVDYEGLAVSFFETYQGQTVKSLLLAAIELALGEKAVIEPTKQLRVGAIKFNLDNLNRVKVRLRSEPDFNYIPFHHVMQQSDWSNRVKNKVVILGYVGPKIPRIQTELGSISAHELFVRILKILFDHRQD